MGIPDVSDRAVLSIVSVEAAISFKGCLLSTRSVVGYILAYLTYLPVIWHHNKTRKVDPDRLSPESRLWWLLYRE